MGLNANAGAMRDPIEWYMQPDDTDEDDNPLPLVKIYDQLMGNVRYLSGEQTSSLGIELTNEVITVLTWYDPRIDNSFYVRFNNKNYQIDHIKPEGSKSMIVTASIQRDG